MIFEVTSPEVTANMVIPKLEEHIELQWILLRDMDSVDLRPKPLKQLIVQWLNYDVIQSFQSSTE